jgi:hypothetical protein
MAGDVGELLAAFVGEFEDDRKRPYSSIVG